MSKIFTDQFILVKRDDNLESYLTKDIYLKARIDPV